MQDAKAADVREAIRRHAALFDTHKQAVIGTTLTGEIVYWSAGAERLYGWSAHQVEGKPILEVTPTESSREQAEKIMAQLKKGRSWAGDFIVQTKSGEEINVLVRDVPVKDETGQLIGLVGLSHPSS